MLGRGYDVCIVGVLGSSFDVRCLAELGECYDIPITERCSEGPCAFISREFLRGSISLSRECWEKGYVVRIPQPE